MIVEQVVNELNLKTYEYDVAQNSFVHMEEQNIKNVYDFTSEIIKLVRYLDFNHIDFEEDLNGNIKLTN